MRDIRLHVIPLTNEEKDAAGKPLKSYDVTPQAFAELIERVNGFYEAADIRFLFDPQFDWAPMANTTINTDAAGQVDLGNAIAAKFPGKMVCFLRWGSGDGRTGNGNAYPPRGVSPEPANTIPRVQNYVMLPNKIGQNFGLLNQGNGAFVAHEFGHHLGLYHTFPGWNGKSPMYDTAPSDTPSGAEADQALVDYIAANGGKISALDGDALTDTPPDPSPRWHTAHGVNLCDDLSITISGKVGNKTKTFSVTLEPNNIMSYFAGCPSWTGPDAQMHFSAQQIKKMSDTLKHKARVALISAPQFGPNSIQPGNVVALSPTRLMLIAADVTGQLWFTHWQQGNNGSRWDRWRPILTNTGVANARASLARRNTNRLDIFTTGTDGKTYTGAWDQARNGQWRGYWNILAGAIPKGGAVTAVSRKADQLDIFIVSTDGGIYTASWNTANPGGAWKGWWRIGTLTAKPGTRVEAISRGPEKLDIFVSGADGKTYTAAWDATKAEGQWRGWWNILSGAIPSGGAVTAITRKPEQIDLFLVSNDGGIYTAAWNRNVADQKWQGWWRIGTLKAKPGTPVSVVSRSPDKLDIFVSGADGKTYTAAWDAAKADGAWRGWWNILSGFVPAGSPIAAVARDSGKLDIFIVSNDCAVYTAAWDRNVADQKWQGWWKIGN